MTSNTHTLPITFLDTVRQFIQKPNNPELLALADSLQKKYPNTIDAILVYGSCLRSNDYQDGLVDLYVVVPSYRKCYGNSILALLNKLLPPNVFYLEIPFEEKTIRAKYAVISMQDINKATSMSWFHSYFWGRFSQPAGLLFCRDTATEVHMVHCLAQSVMTFCTRTVPGMAEPFDALQLWQHGLAQSYAAELRVENKSRPTELYDAAQSYYEALTREATSLLGIARHSSKSSFFSPDNSARKQVLNRFGWALRKGQGKTLSVLRLLKGLITFDGGVDYIVWKLERHSGQIIEVSPRVRRYPVIFIWGLFWRLYRRGIFR